MELLNFYWFINDPYHAQLNGIIMNSRSPICGRGDWCSIYHWSCLSSKLWPANFILRRVLRWNTIMTTEEQADVGTKTHMTMGSSIDHIMVLSSYHHISWNIAIRNRPSICYYARHHANQLPQEEIIQSFLSKCHSPRLLNDLCTVIGTVTEKEECILYIPRRPRRSI